MHPSAMRYGAAFFKKYRPTGSLLDIGSMDINGSLRSVAPKELEYIGVDQEPGRGVDVVAKDPYSLPFENDKFDVCVSTSCFEHSEFFWISFLEIMRVLKPGGLFYLNAPSNGAVHRHPVDCWRFYPDAGKALAGWARRNGINCELLESGLGQQDLDEWIDFVAIFRKQ